MSESETLRKLAALKAKTQSQILRGMSDGEIAWAAKFYQQQGRAKTKEAAELHSRADLLRNEIRRRNQIKEAK